MHYIVEKEFEVQDVKGQRRRFRFALEAPQKIDEVSWGCMLLVEGVENYPNRPHRIVGVDGWQALTLAIRLVEQTLSYFVEDGGQLFWPDGTTPMELNDVVPRFTNKAA